MRYLISTLLIFVLSSHNCAAQNEKINLSSILNSIRLSQNCSYLLNSDDKLFLFSDKDKKVQEIINFDSYNFHRVQVIYNTDKKNILKKLKKVESGRVISVENISQDKNELTFKVDLSKTNYQLYSKSQFRVTLIDSWLDMSYIQKDGKWVLTKITCNGF